VLPTALIFWISYYEHNNIAVPIIVTGKTYFPFNIIPPSLLMVLAAHAQLAVRHLRRLE